MLAGAVSPAQAQSGLPAGGKFVAGNGQISPGANGSLLVKQTSTKGIIDWTSFSIGKGNRVLIDNGAGSTLSRVLGPDFSLLNGTLKATGSFYLINPNGIVIGPDGHVFTGRTFVASTRDVSNDGFLSQSFLNFSGTSTGDVVNNGSIVARLGDVLMIGRSTGNNGTIAAPNGTATLAAANSVILTNLSGVPGVYVAPDTSASGNVTQTGKINAAAAALKASGGDIYTLAGNRTGLISATGSKTINGQVWLTAPEGNVVASGSISAKNADGTGGTILINGKQQVTIDTNAHISAAGTSGGTVLVGTSGGGKDLARSTTLQNGATITSGGPLGNGSIETSGETVQMGQAKIDAGKNGTWLVDPTNLTIDSTAASTIDSALNSGTNVTEQTTATTASGSGVQAAGSGDINVNAPLSWTGSGNLNLSAYNNLNVNSPISGNGSLTGVAGAAVSVNANISASNVALTGSGGNLTLATGVNITAANGITLETAQNFINNSGSSALSPGTGNWLVYSADPSTSVTGGLTPNFYQYAAAPGASASGTGNGLLYDVSPSLSVSLSGTLTKTYDGTTSATLTPGTAAVTGLINSDLATVAGNYASKDVGTGIDVTASSVTPTHNGLPVYGYSGTSPSVTAAIGAITAAQLYASIVGNPTKVYNGTTTTEASSSNYQLTGFVTGESATVNQPSSVSYDSPDAGSRTISATFSPTNFVPGGGTSLSNYTLPTSATGPGTINPAPLQIKGVLATNKTYDRTPTDPLNSSSAALTGIIGSDDVQLVTSGGTGTFPTANAGTGLSVTASGFTLSGTKASDYALTQPTGLTANISPVTLSVTGVAAANKVYDGTTLATLNTGTAGLSGVVPGDTITLGVNNTGQFTQSDVGTGIGVNTSGFTISGTAAPNYFLTQPSGLTANITPAPIYVSIASTPTKTYNGDANAVLNASDFSISGFVNGQSATLPQTAEATYASANAATQTVTANLALSDYTAGGSTKLSNYTLPSSATGTGVINPAPVSISLVGNPTKTYDGNTNATLTSSNYLLSGFLTGQSATVNQTAGTYSSANVGVREVTATISAGNLIPGNGTLISNYSFPTSVTGMGTIMAAPLQGGISASIIGNPTKTYDGTTAATLVPSDFTLYGFQNGDGATVTQTVGTYASKNVGVQPVTATLAPGDFSPNNGTNLSNYTLPSIAYGSGTINPATLIASIINSPTKVYNATTRADLASSSFGITGLAAGENITIGNSITGTYDSTQVGSRTITTYIPTTDITAQPGTLLSNYILPTSATGPGTITQAPLSILGVTAVDKTYDTTTVASLLTGAAHLFGVVGSDSVTLSSAGSSATFASANAGSNVGVTASGFTISGTAASNYQIAQPSGLSATIRPKTLTITGVSALNKNYDNTTAAYLNTGSAALSGVYGSDAAQVSLNTGSASATFSSVNVGNSLSVSASGFALSGAKASNYSLSQPSGLAADIDPAPLTVNIIGNPTKVYDGTTTVSLTGSNYDLTGFVAGQGGSVPQNASAQYVSPNAGTVGVTSTLVSSDFLANAGTNFSNYALPTTGSGTGTITQAPVTATIINNPTKTYDTTTGATLGSTNYSLSGFLSGQGATVGQTSGTYSSGNAGTQTVTASLNSGQFTATGSTDLSNYSLPSTASGSGTINKAPLIVVQVYGTNKTYDNTTNDTLNVATAGVSGLLGSDSVTLNSGSANGTFASKNVGTGIAVTASGFSIAGGQSANYTLAQPTGLTADITQATLNLTNVTRVYDSVTDVPTSATDYTLSGIFGSDSVSINTSAGGFSGSYADKNVGTGKDMTFAGLSLTGAQAGNYIIASTLTNAPIGTITKAPLTILGVNANNKVYDATTAATLDNTSAVISGDLGSDQLILDTSSSSGVFSDKNAGTNKTVTATGYTVGGADAGNYTLSQPTGITANINQYSGISISSIAKTYSGTTALPTTNSAYALSGLLAGDSVQVLGSGVSGSYASKDVAGGIAVTASNISLTGTDAGNYSLPSTLSSATIGTINAKSLSASIINTPTKQYDTNTSATLAPSNFQISGFVSGEGASITKASGTYSSANAGSPTVSTSLLASDFNPNGGTSLSNYILPSSASGSGSITKKPLTISGVAATDKVYDGSTSDTLDTVSASLVGVLSPDVITLSTMGTTGTFASAAVGTGIGVTAAGFTIGGTAAGNYSLSQPTELTANIGQALLTLAAVTKRYDSTTAATGTGVSYTLAGTVGSDNVTLNTTGLSGTYAAKDVGTDLSVSLSDMSLTGAQAGNYVIASSVSNDPVGVITKAPLTVSGAVAVGKVYDGSTTATINNSSATLSGLFGNDAVNLTTPNSGAFSSSNAGSHPVTVSGSYAMSGADAGNYSLTQPSGFSATISKAPINAVIINDPTKVYDGTTSATLTAGNYTLTGFVAGQGATVSQTSGTYSSADAGSPTVTATLTGSNFTATGGAQLSNYTLPTSALGSGTITPKTLSASIINNPAKTYDGGATATLTSANYSISGFVGSQGATVNQTSGTYSTANAGTATVSASLAPSNFTATGGANFADYNLPTSASGTGTINKEPLNISVIGTPSKTYDGSTTATLNSANYSLSGFIGSDGATVTKTAGTYSTSDAGSDTVNVTLAPTDFTATGGALFSNYTLPTTAFGPGLINKATLLASIIGNPTKTYDGTTSEALTPTNFSLTGFASGQSASVTQTSGTYGSSDAGTVSITASLASTDFNPGNGTSLSNYNLPTTASGSGTINAKTVSASIIGDPGKTYDGTTNLALASNNYLLSGFVNGQGATVNDSSGTLSSADAGSTTVAATLAGNLFTPATGTNLANYNLPTTASGAATVTPALVSANVIGTPVKTYDGTSDATLTAGNYSLSGFVAGQGATVTQTSGTYSSSHAGSPTVTATLAAGNFTATGTTNFSNYILPSTAIGNGEIDPKTVNASIVNSPTKVYDATTTATLNQTNFSLSGFLVGQGATVNQTSGTYSSANAGSSTVSASLAETDFTPAIGTVLSDYALPSAVSGAGTITKAPLFVSIVDTPTKTYDGYNSATLNAGNYNLTGFASTEGAAVNQTSGTYSTATAGSDTVSALLATNNFAPQAGTNLANYTLPTTASGAGLINQAPLTINIVGIPAKTYDGTNSATLASSNYSLTGFANSETASVTQTAGTYSTKNAGTPIVTASLTPSDFTPGSGTTLSNYILPLTATGPGLINPKTITAAITGNPTKVYDGTTQAALNTGNYSLSGFIAGEGASVDQSTGTYGTANAGLTSVTATLTSSNVSPNAGTNLANYTLPVSASGAGTITKAPLSATIVGTPTKTYDGGTSALLSSSNYNLTGFAAAEGATVNQQSGTYSSPDAGSNTVNASLLAGNLTPNAGTDFANYTLPTSASGSGLINRAPLAAAIIGTPTKTYDGANAATLTAANYSLNGFVAGQGGTINQTAGAYDQADAGNRTVTASLAASNYVVASGTKLSNYLLPQSASGAGVINPQALSASIANNPSKPYDGGTAASLMPGNYSLTGFVTGQSAVVTQTIGAYSSADAGTPTVTAKLAPADFSAASGTNLANYTLPTSATGVGTITARTLTASIIGTPSKTYDGTNAAILGSTNYALTGFVAGQGATLSQTSGTFDSANAGQRTVLALLTASSFQPFSGTSLSNYLLPSTASGAGTIMGRALAISITGNPTKMGDGSTAIQLSSSNFVVSGFIQGEGATVSAGFGNFDSADAGTRLVTALTSSGMLLPNPGTLVSNYLIPVSASGPGLITPAVLTNAATLQSAMQNNMAVRALGSPQQIIQATNQALVSAVVPRAFIPYPSSSTLSTWQNNGFASLPSILEAATAAAITTNAGDRTVSTGAPIINTTEQILLQGGHDKSWRLLLPPSPPVNSPAQQ